MALNEVTVRFTPTEEDLLAYKLYLASQSARVRDGRYTLRTILFVIMLILAFLAVICFRGGFGFLIGGVIVVASLLLYLFYPTQQSRLSTEQSKNIIDEQMKDFPQTHTTVSMTQETVHAWYEQKEISFPTRDIANITEQKNLFIVKLNNQKALVLPKERIDNAGELGEYLRRLSSRLLLEYPDDPGYQ